VAVVKGTYTISATFGDGSTVSVKIDIDAYTPPTYNFFDQNVDVGSDGIIKG
jgi:hypothetical protein